MRKQHPLLTPPEEAVLLHFVRSKWPSAYWPCAFMARLGLRLAESCVVRWTWINITSPQRWYITIPADAAKSATYRTLPLSLKLKLELEAHLQTRFPLWINTDLPTEFITPLRGGKPPSNRWVQRSLQLAGGEALKRHVHPHLLRHSFADRLLRHTNLPTVQKFLGHKSIQTTQKYTHPNLQDLTSALDKKDIAELPSDILL